MKCPYLIVAKHQGYEVTATTVHAEDLAEAMALGAGAVRRMAAQAKQEGRSFAVKSVEVMLKSGSMAVR